MKCEGCILYSDVTDWLFYTCAFGRYCANAYLLSMLDSQHVCLKQINSSYAIFTTAITFRCDLLQLPLVKHWFCTFSVTKCLVVAT